MNELSERLEAVISMIPVCQRVLDIGTDHAYLPIELVKRQIAEQALACDIAEGPLQRAKSHIEESGLTSVIQIRLTDGLHHTEDFHPDVILILGMGGEMIAKILSECDYLKTERPTLFLNPMTKADYLRKWLWKHGFEIVDETIAEKGRYYQIEQAVYNGNITSYTEVDALLGKINIQKNQALFHGMLEREIKSLTNIMESKKQSTNSDTAFEKKLRDELEKLNHENR